MSLEGSTKRSGVPVSSDDASILNDNDDVPGFDSIPTECKISILQFLDVDSLGNVAQVSRRFHDDSLNPSLPHNRTATLTCVRRVDESTGLLTASPFSLLQKLIDKSWSDKYWRFNKVKIIGHNLLENVSIPEVRNMLPGYIMLQHVRVLDLSFPSNALKKDTTLKVCIPAILTYVMPCLKEIDLSNANVTESALRYFAYECPVLEKVTWNNHFSNTHMSGKALDECPRLKEIYMDDSVFTYGFGESQAICSPTEWLHYCIFSHCNANLERVSLQNAKVREPEFCSAPGPKQIFPQSGLMKFVRNTPSLRWFRSDLSPENVAILRVERPEVTFA
jgi:hypothetical protein